MPNATITVGGVENAASKDKKFKLKKQESVRVWLSGTVNLNDSVTATFTSKDKFSWTTPNPASVEEDASHQLCATFASTPTKKDHGGPFDETGDLTVQITDTSTQTNSEQTFFQVDYIV